MCRIWWWHSEMVGEDNGFLVQILFSENMALHISGTADCHHVWMWRSTNTAAVHTFITTQKINVCVCVLIHGKNRYVMNMTHVCRKHCRWCQCRHSDAFVLNKTTIVIKLFVPYNNMKYTKDLWSILSYRRNHRWADYLDMTELSAAIHMKKPQPLIILQFDVPL
jgi:hypothetical protein